MEILTYLLAVKAVYAMIIRDDSLFEDSREAWLIKLVSYGVIFNVWEQFLTNIK